MQFLFVGQKTSTKELNQFRKGKTSFSSPRVKDMAQNVFLGPLSMYSETHTSGSDG